MPAPGPGHLEVILAPAGAPTPGVAPPSGRPPAGLLALARARWAVLRQRGRVSAGRGATLGRGVRWELAPGARVHLGAHCAIGPGTRLTVGDGTVQIGPGAWLGDACVVRIRSALRVGAGACLADGVVLLDERPVFADPERPIRRQGTQAHPVTVGARVRIGAGTVVGPGAVIGDGATVLGSLVVETEVLAGAHVTERSTGL